MNRCNFRYGLAIPVILGVGVGLAACSDDTKVKVVPVDVPVARQLTTRPLFGGMPLDNRVLDPEFSIIDGQAWVPYTQEMPRLSRVFLPRTPLGQSALWVPTEGNSADLTLLGSAKSGVGALDASVWFGRPVSGDDTDLVRVVASVIGLFADGGEASVDLAVDSATEPKLLDDILWRRFAVHLPVAPSGWLYLAFSNTAPADLYISSPMVLTGPPTLGLAPTGSMGVRRVLSSRERAALTLAKENEKDRLARGSPRRRR